VIGDRAISLEQIQATQPMNVRERDADGALANCAIYLAVALLFFCGVMMFEELSPNLGDGLRVQAAV
jgi:hypothetical protein